MKRTLHRFAAAALALGLLLSLSACGRKTSGKIPGSERDSKTIRTLPKKDAGSKSGAQTAPAQSEPASGSKPGTQGSPSLAGKPSGSGAKAEQQTPVDAEAQAALAQLRQYMEDTAQAAAVAYLGYRDAAERSGALTDWLWTNVPGLMETMAFLQSIPSDRVLNGDYGDLYCIVPRDEHTSLAVNHVVWRSNERGVWPEADEVLYRSEYAEPLLLFVRWEEFQDEPDVEVVIVPDDGTGVNWCPIRDLENGGYIEIPTGVDYEPLLLDFSSFGDVTGLDYADNLWAPPTELGLADSIWNCGSWMLELYSGGEPDSAGAAALSCQQEDGQAYQLICSGVWRMENDCLRLELTAQDGASVSGSFPVYIDLSGEHLILHRDGETHVGLPFFDDNANYMELMLSYG